MKFHMVRYLNVSDLDSRIEFMVKDKAKCYPTDWTRHGRIKYYRYKNSNNPDDKKFILLLGECTTYIIRICDLYKDKLDTAIFESYQVEKNVDYYYVDLNELRITKINPLDNDWRCEYER